MKQGNYFKYEITILPAEDGAYTIKHNHGTFKVFASRLDLLSWLSERTLAIDGELADVAGMAK